MKHTFAVAVAVLVAAGACSSTEDTGSVGRARDNTIPLPNASPSSSSSSSSSSGASSGQRVDATASLDAGAATDASDAGESLARSHFECVAQGSAFRPYWRRLLADGSIQDYPPLGQNAMTTRAECDQACAAAQDGHGVICSRTGLDGWKPTLYTGTVPGRADFGYLGGSSIVKLDDCLAATRNASMRGVCFWGGSDWYVAPIDHEATTAGPFATIDACIATTR